MNIEKMKQSQFKCKKRAQLKQYEKLKQKYSNESLQTIRISNRKLNCLRWGSNETKEHILKKLDICIELKEINHNFITEAIFINGSRADIVDLTDNIIYEVLVSEKEESFKEKIKKYPKEFTIIKVKV